MWLWWHRVQLALVVMVASVLWCRMVVVPAAPGRGRLWRVAPVVAAYYLLPFLFDWQEEVISVMAIAYMSVRLPATKVMALALNRGALADPSLTMLQFAAFLLCPITPAPPPRPEPAQQPPAAMSGITPGTPNPTTSTPIRMPPTPPPPAAALPTTPSPPGPDSCSNRTPPCPNSRPAAVGAVIMPQPTNTAATPPSQEQPTRNPTPAAPEEQPTRNPTPTPPEEQPTSNPTPPAPEEQPTSNHTPTAPEEQPTHNPTPTPPEEQPTRNPTPTAPEEQPTHNSTTTPPQQPPLAPAPTRAAPRSSPEPTSAAPPSAPIPTSAAKPAAPATTSAAQASGDGTSSCSRSIVDANHHGMVISQQEEKYQRRHATTAAGSSSQPSVTRLSLDSCLAFLTSRHPPSSYRSAAPCQPGTAQHAQHPACSPRPSHPAAARHSKHPPHPAGTHCPPAKAYTPRLLHPLLALLSPSSPNPNPCSSPTPASAPAPTPTLTSSPPPPPPPPTHSDLAWDIIINASTCSTLLSILPHLPPAAPPALRHLALVFTMTSFISSVTDTLAIHLRPALGRPLLPHFVAPLAATSLSDFWGRRWNLTQAAALKALLYEPLVEGRLVAAAPPPHPSRDPPSGAHLAATLIPHGHLDSSSCAPTLQPPLHENSPSPASSPPLGPHISTSIFHTCNPAPPGSSPEDGNDAPSTSSSSSRRRHSTSSIAPGPYSRHSHTTASTTHPGAAHPHSHTLAGAHPQPYRSLPLPAAATKPAAAAGATTDAAGVQQQPGTRPPTWRRLLVACLVFLYSGWEHALFYWYLTHAWDWRLVWFFALQGPLLAVEQVGRRAGRALGVRVPVWVSRCAALVVLEVTAAAWFFPVLEARGLPQRCGTALGTTVRWVQQHDVMRELVGSYPVAGRFATWAGW